MFSWFRRIGLIAGLRFNIWCLEDTMSIRRDMMRQVANNEGVRSALWQYMNDDQLIDAKSLAGLRRKLNDVS